jgi:hypothetical protein
VYFKRETFTVCANKAAKKKQIFMTTLMSFHSDNADSGLYNVFTLALTLGALDLVNCFSLAAGISISQSASKILPS